jgi:hypothetical protein
VLILGERLGAGTPVQQMRGDGDIPEGCDAIRRIALNVGEAEQLTEDHRGRPRSASLRDCKIGRHRGAVEGWDCDVVAAHARSLGSNPHAGDNYLD